LPYFGHKNTALCCIALQLEDARRTSHLEQFEGLLMKWTVYQYLPFVNTYRVVDRFVKTRPKRLHPLLPMSMFLTHARHRDVSFLSKKCPASELLASLLGISVSGRRSSEK
jgi:hypothetical protein